MITFHTLTFYTYAVGWNVARQSLPADQDVLNTLDMRFLNLTHGISVCKPCPANATVGFVYGDVDIFNSLAKAMAMGLDIIGLTGTGQHTGFLP